jgi:hypothetical protein
MPQLQKDMARVFIFQQDGTPPNFHCEVTVYISHTVPLWFGWGPIMWTPWSPDLTPLDFCLWGYMKDAVYAPPSNNPTSVTCTDNRCSCISWCRNGIKSLPVGHLSSDTKKPHQAFVTETWQYLASLDTTDYSIFVLFWSY